MKTNINHTLWTGALVLSICSALTSTAAAQSFDQIPGFLTKIAVGTQTVAGINDSTQVVTWDTASSKFEPIPGGSGPFITVAVGGGTLLQADEVWALNTDQQIFRLSNGSFTQIPGQLTQIAIGPGFETCHPAEVWGLNNASGEVFRFDSAAANSTRPRASSLRFRSASTRCGVSTLPARFSTGTSLPSFLTPCQDF